MAACGFMGVGMSQGRVGRTLERRSKKAVQGTSGHLPQVASLAALLSLESQGSLPCVVLCQSQNQGIQGSSEAENHTQLFLPGL